jgi:DNA topoisomerase-1
VEKFKTITGTGKRKAPTDQLFDTFDATDLNKELKSIMDGLSVKVRLKNILSWGIPGCCCTI